MTYDERYLGIARTSEVCAILSEAFASGSGGQSYLLESPDKLLCVYTALAAVCAENGGAESPVGRRVLSGKCADVRIVGEEGMRAADADEVISLSAYSPAELKRRAFILDFSDTNEAVQNKLLKTLEEPPRGSVFFVISPAAEKLLPTVASRLEKLAPSLGKDVTAAMSAFSGANLPYALYGGADCLSEFDALLRGVKTDSLIRAIKLVQTIGGSAEMAQAVSLLAARQRTELRDIFAYTERIFGDVMREHGGVHTDTHGLFNLKSLADKYPLGGLPAIIRLTRRAAIRAAGGNLAAVADTFVIGVTEVNHYAKSSGRQI